MNSCHRSLKFLGKFFKSYVLSGGYDSKGTPSFQSTAFRDGLATTFLIVDDHTTILLASLQGEFKDHRLFPFFQPQFKGQDRPCVPFKEALKISLSAICTKIPCEAFEPKLEIQRCQHCRSGSSSGFGEENMLVELVFDQ